MAALTGSGGGNHITIGGPHAEPRSPWLVRPDVLASRA
jgi:uncharacterized protein (DUF2126 family)